jgi:hypothetical protein
VLVDIQRYALQGRMVAVSDAQTGHAELHRLLGGATGRPV